MRIQLSRNSTIPLYLQIVNQIKKQISEGEIPAGYKLPPERRLAESLGVNRTTILSAYRELKAAGLIDSRIGSGTEVIGSAIQQSGRMPDKPSWNYFFSEYATRGTDRTVNDLLSLANRQDIISFATGIASLECSPKGILEGIEEELLQGGGDQQLLHSPVEGFRSLRHVIAAYMERKGVYCLVEEVMVLSGSQQGIDLAARVLIDPGDIVIMEDPTFFPALKVFKMVGARVIGVAMEADGMDMTALADLLERYRPKLLYTIPSFHNPTGIEMSLAKRKRLLELITQFKTPVIEDDAYGDLCYDTEALPTLKGMDQSGLVIYLNTFSKTVYPGLRIGWSVADRKVIERFVAVRQIVDLHTNCLSQKMIERYLASGKMEAHLDYICVQYRKHRDLMIACLQEQAPPDFLFQPPKGGYYLWCKLPKGIAEDDLVKRAAQHGVVFLPGSMTFVTPSEEGYIRLNFTFASLLQIRQGVTLLCQALKELQEETGRIEIDQWIDLNPIV